MKKCTKCFETKEILNFYKSKNYTGGHSTWCKICTLKKNKKNKNTDKYRTQQSKYQKENRQRLMPARIKAARRYSIKREKIDLNYRLRNRIRTSLYIALINNQKNGEIIDLLGCSIQDFKKHLQNQFIDGMSWSNYGRGKNKWCIDHIQPIKDFDMTNESQKKQANHYSNLRPLWFIDNCKRHWIENENQK